MEYFDYGEESRETEFDVEQFLEQSQEAQRERLETDLDRVNEQLENRERILEENTRDLRSKLDWYIERLESAYRTTGPVEDLKDQIEDFYRLIREERRKHWLDTQELKRERRELVRELRELEDVDLHQLL